MALNLPRPPFDEEIEERMLRNHTIHIDVSGCVTGKFDRAIEILQSSNLLERIQVAYAALLSDGEKPEFEVYSVTNAHYFYTNKYQERSDIYEIRRGVDVADGFFEGIIYVQGERGFGMFESMITMRVRRADSGDPDRLTYHADVHVYPHCMALRLFLKYVPGIKRYFRNKTAEMQVIISGVFDTLLASCAGANGVPVLRPSENHEQAK